MSYAPVLWSYDWRDGSFLILGALKQRGMGWSSLVEKRQIREYRVSSIREEEGEMRMPKVIRNSELIQQKTLELEFLQYAMSLGYTLMDFELIDQYTWNELNQDQLYSLARSYNWTNGNEISSLRWDWTNTIVQYQKKYQLKADRIAYSGPVYSREGGREQLGLEIFSQNVIAQQELLIQAISFIGQQMDSPLSIAVLGHNRLLKKILKEEQLADQVLKAYIEARNAKGLAEVLGNSHPLIQLMDLPPMEQIGYLDQHYPELHRHIDELNTWFQIFVGSEVPNVYIDVLALPTQSYYRGIFFKAYHQGQRTPILVGGQYTANKKAFGVGISTGNIILKTKDEPSGGQGK